MNMQFRFSLASLLLLVAALLCSGCGLTIPKYTTIQSNQPPSYYLGESPNVRVVNAEGATRRLQDITIQELRDQSRSNGHFIIENGLSEGIRFDVRRGRPVMTGREASVSANDVLIKFNVIASMKSDQRTTVTRQVSGAKRQVPIMQTVMPVAFTVTKGEDVLLNERQYNGKAVWAIDQNGGGYPNSYQRRFEMAVGLAVKKFLKDVTPTTVSRRVRLDYSDEQQKPILNAARDGQVKEAATQLEEYVAQNPNSASAAYNLAVLTDALGQYERAMRYYDEALSLGGKDYYNRAKTGCMKRLNAKREMVGASPTSTSSMRQAPPPSTSGRTAAQTAPQTEERPGDGGDDTAWVQRTLNDLNYACGTPDGVMGPNTRSCIRAFQQANGLDATGEVDEATYERMLNRLQ